MSGYYASNPHYQPTDFSEARERYERCEEEAGKLFADATKAQTAAYHRALSDLRGLSAPRYDRARDAAKATFDRSTAEARELCEQSMMDLMTLGEVSQTTWAGWDALAALEAVSVAMLEVA